MIVARTLLVAGMLALSMHQAFAGGSPFIDDLPPSSPTPTVPGR